jgi:hypothetical protein
LDKNEVKPKKRKRDKRHQYKITHELAEKIGINPFINRGKGTLFCDCNNGHGYFSRKALQ